MTRFVKRTARSARRRPLLALLSVPMLAVGGWAVSAALAAPGPPAPSLTESPNTSPTKSTSIAFHYSDSRAGSTFTCKLDGKSKTCTGTTSGAVTFNSLAQGSHTFQITAVSGGKSGGTTSYSWTIDTSAPTAAITFPRNNGIYDSAGYSAGCAPAGICGTAADPSGVASVRVSIKRGSTGKYWNGSSFTTSGETFNTASGTTSWRYVLALPPDDIYTVHVQATDTLGNTQGAGAYAASASFTIDTTPHKTALFADDAGCGKAGITFSGSSNTVSGYSHSNGAFKVFGSRNTFGPSDAVCSPSISGSRNTFDGAGAPAHGTSLNFPETYSKSTVCSQPGVHTGTNLTISSGTPSGIYCYTGSITLSESNLTATVTFVAPSIALRGSKLKLTPAYQDLLAYDTNTTVGRSGLTVSGSNITTHGATIYAPYANVAISGSRYSWDGLIEGRTITFSGCSSTFTGEGPPAGGGAGHNYTMGTNPIATLYPGGPASTIDVTFSNPNTDTVRVSTIHIVVSSVTGGSGVPRACTAGDYAITDYTGSPFFIPIGPSSLSTISPAVPSSSWPTIRMLDNGNQDGCQGATVHLGLTGAS